MRNKPLVGLNKYSSPIKNRSLIGSKTYGDLDLAKENKKTKMTLQRLRGVKDTINYINL